MNYLAHLYLSAPSDGCLLGSLMGDFIKGPVPAGLPAAIRQGVSLHRRVDQFAQNNAIFQRSKQRIDRSFGHCRGILIDVFYDHLLARHWDTYSPQSLEDFAGRIYDLLAGNSSYLPAGLQRIAPHMIRNNWLVSYRETATVGRVLERLAGRLRRPNPLAAGLPELLENYVELEGDCRDFLSEAAAYVRAMG